MEEEFPGQSIIDGLNTSIDDVLIKFSGQVSKAEDELLRQLLRSLEGLDLSKAGTIAKSVANVRKINDVRKVLAAAQNGGQYSQAVRELVGQFRVQAKVLDSYFAGLRIANPKGQKLYGALVDEYITQTAAQLYTGGFGATLEPQILDILKTHVTTGAPIAELRAQVSAVVQGDRVLAARAETIADNALNQFSRNYIQAVSDDLGLTHYFYKGTVIKTTRPFCRPKVGQYFTEAEVLDWGDQDFAGKIKGTDRANIKTNLGGNRCRHRLIPITEELYNVKTGRSGQLGLFA